jgi:hypothetical protein
MPINIVNVSSSKTTTTIRQTDKQTKRQAGRLAGRRIDSANTMHPLLQTEEEKVLKTTPTVETQPPLTVVQW